MLQGALCIIIAPDNENHQKNKSVSNKVKKFSTKAVHQLAMNMGN